MRTTLSIDDDVLLAVKSQAARQKKSIGEVLSALARQALHPEPAGDGAAFTAKVRNGVPLLAHLGTSKPVTLELVNRLRDELV